METHPTPEDEISSSKPSGIVLTPKRGSLFFSPPKRSQKLNSVDDVVEVYVVSVDLCVDDEVRLMSSIDDVADCVMDVLSELIWVLNISLQIRLTATNPRSTPNKITSIRRTVSFFKMNILFE
ncbi:hypothetical protein B6U74_05150 [Candidatus Bathyarchaeota archaeon ex4484_205]|nr:MAG: hypothetical protein B6U74_05150 [Candidatus Bathyarchaeota archaeon ex4484_205]